MVPSARCKALSALLNVVKIPHARSMEYENDMKELSVVDVENVEIENTAESADEA